MLSREHLLPVGSYGNLKASRDVVLGDVVFVMSDGSLETTRVTGIETVIKKGAYCPHTTGKSVTLQSLTYYYPTSPFKSTVFSIACIGIRQEIYREISCARFKGFTWIHVCQH